MKAEKDGKSYNVMKNVSTHSMINANDGELDLRLELEDIGNDTWRKREINYLEYDHGRIRAFNQREPTS